MPRTFTKSQSLGSIKSYNNNDHKVLITKENEEEQNETTSSLFNNCQIRRWKYRTQLRLLKYLFGILIIFISLAILFWNERKAATVSKSYYEGLGSIRILPNALNIQPENDGKLVYVNGYLYIPDTLEDNPYGVSISAVKLKRRVQMFQWVEERLSQPNELFEQVPYRYTKMWRDKLINSDGFGIPKDHENPKDLPVKSEIRINSDVRLGSFLLGPELKDKFTNFIQFTSGERPAYSHPIKVHMGLYYHSSSIWNPQIGDLRVQFSFAGATDTFISIIAMQYGKELKPFITESGIEILYLYEGRVNHLEIFKNEHATFVYRCWATRIIVWVVQIAGSFLVTKPISLLNRRNQIVRNVIALGRFKLSFYVATTMSLFTIGCGWIINKPVFGTLLIIFSWCLLFYQSLVQDNECKSCGIKIQATTVKPPYSSYTRSQTIRYQHVQQRTQMKFKD